MSGTQLPSGCGVNIGVHVYKENKLKMAKHPGCLTRYLQASATDLSRKQSEIPYNVDRFQVDRGANGGFHKRRKVEDSNQCLLSDISCTQLQCFQSPVMVDQPRYFPHKQPYNFSTSSTTNANMSHITCLYASQNVGNASGSVSSKNISKFSTSQGDYAIVVGEVLSSANESYEVLSFLGRGTFGQVVKCRSQSSKRCVAVKILKNLPSYLRQGNVEIQILQTLSKEDTESHNIVRAIECFQHKCHMCFVFELLEQNLYEYLKSNKFRPLALTEIRPIAQQVLTALSKLKSLGLIHADLKPENIMLASSTSGPMRYRVKVIDFGSACHSSKAVQNTYLQSRYYRAPEILLGLPFNEAIDMWSLGCVVAELFLGWPLYPGSSEYDQMRYIVETQGLPPSDLLQNAAKTATFFVCDPYRYEWRMKTQEEYTVETGQQAKEARKYFFSSLAQICDVAGISPLDSPEHNCEVEDRQQFANLLMLMLIIRPADRVVPDTALQHPFITMNHLQRHPFSKRFHESMILMQICHESVRRQHLQNVRSNNLNMKTHQEVQRYNSLASSRQSLDTQCVMKNEPLSSSNILYSPHQIANNAPTSLLMNTCPPSSRKSSIISPSLYYQPQAPANNSNDATAAYYAAAAAAAATALTSSKSSVKNSAVTTGLSAEATIRAAPEVKYLRPQRYSSQARASGQQRSSNAHHLQQEEEHSLHLGQRHQLIPAIAFLPQSSEPPLLPITCSSETRPSTATAAAAAAAAAATVLLAQTNADAYLLRQQQLPFKQQKEPVVLVHSPSPSQSTLYGLAIAANGAENALSLLNAAAAAAVTRASNTASLEFVGQSQGGFRLSSVDSGHLQQPQTAAVQQMTDHCHPRHTQQEAYLSAMDAERAALVLSSYLTKERGTDGSSAMVYNISRHHYNQQEPRPTNAYLMMPPPPPPECQTAALPNVLRISSTASTVDLQETLNAFVQHQQSRKHQEQHYHQQQQQQHDLYRNPTAAAAAAAVAALGGFNHQSQQHCQGLLTNRARQLQDVEASKYAIDRSTLMYTSSRPKPQTLHQALVTPQVRSDQNLQHHQQQMYQTFRVPHSHTDTSEILRMQDCYTRGQENRLSASFNCGKPHDLRLTTLTTTTPSRTNLNCSTMANSTASMFRSHPVLPTTTRHHQDPDQQPHQHISSQTPHITFSSTPITRSCTPTCQCHFNATSADCLLDNSDMPTSNSGDIVPMNLATCNAQQCNVESKASHTRQSQPVQHHRLSASHSFEDVKPQNALLEYETLLQVRATLQETLPEYVRVSHENGASDKVSVTKVEHSFSTASHNDAMFADCRSTVVQPQTSRLQQNRIAEKKIPVGRVQPMVKQEECFASPPRLQVSSPTAAPQRRIPRYSEAQQAVGCRLPPLYPLEIDTNRLSDGQQQQVGGVQHRHLPVVAPQRQQDAQNSSTARNLSAAHAAAAAYHNIMFFQLQQQQQQQQQRAMQPAAHHYQNQLQQILSSETIPTSGLGYANQPLLLNQSEASIAAANWMSLASTSSSGVYAQQDRHHQQQQKHRHHQQQPLADSATAAAAASYYAAAAAAAAVAQHRGRQELEHKLLLIDNQDQQQKLRLLTGHHHHSDYCAQ